ncbi:hypothetical protein HPB47_013498 [Ixodes persulcatus]|uniref:Uncharacterized protein n=1 Tax=Ixodes persulcatus TaxID=34615 RepID=A0AC60R2Z8_IXOPE|nr:hypothetical protein HPB47_013498 [Ixodes persulcatus]
MYFYAGWCATPLVDECKALAGQHLLGDLKQRFQRLYDTDSIQQAVVIVVGACALTNVCNRERDALLEPQDPTRESGTSVSSPEGLEAEPPVEGAVESHKCDIEYIKCARLVKIKCNDCGYHY